MAYDPGMLGSSHPPDVGAACSPQWCVHRHSLAAELVAFNFSGYMSKSTIPEGLTFVGPRISATRIQATVPISTAEVASARIQSFASVCY